MSEDNDSAAICAAAFFCAQAVPPDEEYLNGLHSFLSQHQHGKSLLRELSDLKHSQIWSTIATANKEVASLHPGLPEHVEILCNWAAKGLSEPLAVARSEVLSLPLLIILQVGQYLRYLEHHKISHKDFLANVGKGGGLQGFCGGLATAIAISSAADEAGVVQHTATVVRILMAIAAYGEAADDSKGKKCTTLALRLKYELQGVDLTQAFPGTYVSAIAEPKSISIVGPSDAIHDLFNYAREEEQLQVQKIDVRGKLHNPENQDLAKALCKLCDETPGMQLPDASQLKAPVRSNRTGQRLTKGCSLAAEIVTTFLASRCEWYTVLGETAKDLKAKNINAPKLINFGLSDVVSLAPFLKENLRPVKAPAPHGLIVRKSSTLSPPVTVKLPENSIAIIGASCRLPGANNLEQLWELLASGADRHEPLGNDRFNLHGSFLAYQRGNFANERKFYGNFIDDIRRFDNRFFGVNPREAAAMDPQQRILLEIAFEALDDAGYLAKHRREDFDEVGCFIGASYIEYLDNTKANPPSAYTASGTIRAFLCGRLSYYFGWSGPAEVIDTACSASVVAINRACKSIQAGECHMALCGGINMITGFNNYMDLGKAGFLSPTGQCKPFDASADGYCRSDGTGLVVLKKLSRAIADGDNIMGVIPGIATNQGGLSTSITVPQAGAQKALYRKVLEQSNLHPESVTYVEAHGTGTQAGDPLEVDSIRTVFGKASFTKPSDRTLYIGSIKGHIGHCEPAAGVAGLLKVLVMMKHKQIPPQANHKVLNPKIPPLEPDQLAISRSLCKWDAPFRAALINSYGAAGSNGALLCCEMPETKKTNSGYVMKLPLLISAASEKSLLENGRVLGSYLGKHSSDIDIGDVAYSLKERRKRHKFVAVVETNDPQDASSLLKGLQPQDIFQNESPNPVLLVFSGQFDNKVNLDKVVYDRIPAFRHYIDVCDKELLAQDFPSILPSIFDPEPPESALLLQCGIFALQYACAKCWIDAGLRPSAVIGHSLGELTALAVSDVLSLADAIKLVASRARLIDTKWGPDKGSMLSLGNCSTSDFDSLCQSLKGDTVTMACHNGPSTIVAAGPSDAINHLEQLVLTDAKFQSIRPRRIATSHGFHSSLAEPLLADVRAISQTLEWNEPLIPLEMCSTPPPDSFKHYDPSKHLREPVLFVDAVQRLENRLGSATVWLEAGINTPSVVMARAALGHNADTHTFLGIRATGNLSALDSLSNPVSTLWRKGQFVNHWQFISKNDEMPTCKPVWLPPYQFERTQHWLAQVDRVAEFQQAMLKDAHAPRPPSVPMAMVSPKSNMSTQTNGWIEFTINNQHQRFRQIVSGHAVRSRPLCPASMYMESAVMAYQLLSAQRDDLPRIIPGATNLIFEEVSFQAPLSTSIGSDIIVRLKQAEGSSWSYSICTLQAPSRETVHGSGVFSFVGRHPLDAWQRLTSQSMKKILEEREDAEKFRTKTAYSLFSRVVEYLPYFQGIHSLLRHEQEAVATIRMPGDQPAREESTAWEVCETVTIDSFIQVLGFLINMSDFVETDKIAIMSGLDQAVISSKCDFTRVLSEEHWRVYARFGLINGNQQHTIGDVFVFNIEDDELVAALTGCRFSIVPIVKVEKSLDHAIRLQETKQKAATPALAPNTISVAAPAVMGPIAAPVSVSVTIPLSDSHPLPVEEEPSASSSAAEDSDGYDSSNAIPSTDVSSVVEQPLSSSNQQDDLLTLVSECTGIDKSEMPQDKILADLGLDSLAAIDLAGELYSKFSLQIVAHELEESTLKDLSVRISLI